MAKLEKDIIQKLINKNFIKFYIRFYSFTYVDDTLLLVKDEDIDPILKELNSYNKNIKFTVDRFINEDVHFLDIKFIKITLIFIIKTRIRATILTIVAKHQGNLKHHG